MTALGFGEILGGLYIGQVIDRFGNEKAAISNIIVIAIQTAVALSYIAIGEYGWLAYFMAFTWGFQDNCLNTHISEILGFEFDDN